MRVKSHWFKAQAPHSAEQQAGAMAFIAWRAARHMLQRLRDAGFEIDAGAAYFAFLREASVFLIAVIDRIAFARLDAAQREAFTATLVQRVADTYADNAADLIGPRADGTPHRDAFIDAANELLTHYGEFGADPRPDDAAGGFTPDFAFMRYFGARVADTLPPHDQRWVLDPVMAIEAPQAVQTVQRAMRDLWSSAPRRRRASISGD
jgi:hypothetical protein